MAAAVAEMVVLAAAMPAVATVVMVLAATAMVVTAALVAMAVMVVGVVTAAAAMVAAAVANRKMVQMSRSIFFHSVLAIALPVAGFAATPAEIVQTQRDDTAQRLNVLQAKLNDLLACQKGAQLWDGNSCTPNPNVMKVPTGNIRVSAPIKVAPDIRLKQGGTVVHGMNRGGGSRDSVFYTYTYTCSWGSSRSVSNIVGDEILVQPYICDSKTVKQWE